MSASATIMLAADLLLWLVIALDQNNFAILAIHGVLLALCIAGIRLWRPAATDLFSAALALRSTGTALAWYFAHDEARRTLVGTNQDSYLFWSASSLSYTDASLSFEDPLFPRLNVLIHHLSSALGAPSYLANTQTVMFAGALLVVFAGMLIEQLYGRRVGRTTGWLMAVNPAAIVFSTGLMRDALIGMFGFLFLLSLNSALIRRQLGTRLVAATLLVVSALALAFLRSISLAGFVIAGFIMLMSSTPHQQSTLSRNVRLTIVAVLAGILAFAMVDRFDRFEGMLDHAITVRAGEYLLEGGDLNADGITTKIAEISPALFVLISPYALLQPMPFYSWDAPDYIGGPPALMDVVLSFGGLFNQLLFGFYILAIGHWFRTRDTFGARLGFAFTLLLGAMTLAGLGQIRMIMAHVHPFFFTGVALALVQVLGGNRRSIKMAFCIWLACLAALYLGYVAYRDWGSAALAALMLLAAGYALWRLWLFGGPTPARRRQTRLRPFRAHRRSRLRTNFLSPR